LTHELDGVRYKTKISTLRGDYEKPDGTVGNRLRLWDRSDFQPQEASAARVLRDLVKNQRLG
jgi:putative DNA methylase